MIGGELVNGVGHEGARICTFGRTVRQGKRSDQLRRGDMCEERRPVSSMTAVL
jgi:hypothetical protein